MELGACGPAAHKPTVAAEWAGHATSRESIRNRALDATLRHDMDRLDTTHFNPSKHALKQIEPSMTTRRPCCCRLQLCFGCSVVARCRQASPDWTCTGGVE